MGISQDQLAEKVGISVGYVGAQRIDQCDAYEIGLLEATFTAILAYHRFFEMNETIEAYEKTADNS